ncbi:hypothetical protein IAI18_05430 [Acetobacteraceae bacterium H6797]|nr:hypothetical protein [Acetobacteraceae bacterium H6797]
MARELARTPDLAHRLRQLRFFETFFEGEVEMLARDVGGRVSVDRARLTRAFVEWAASLEKQRGAAGLDRRDFSVFAAGLLLAKLAALHPILAESPLRPAANLKPALREIVTFWPEGFLATGFCLTTLQAVLEQEGEAPLQPAPALHDLAHWWSFRENCQEDPASAVGFFDLFLGGQPNWSFPDLARARPAMQRAFRRRHGLEEGRDRTNELT